MSGIKINKIEELADSGFQQEVIGTRLAKTFFKQIFEYGFFHADPHPGNLLVMPNGHICYLDFGMMGSILPRDIQVFGHLFIAIIKKDVKKIITALQKLSSNSAVENMRDLEFDINEFLEKHYVRTIHKNEMSTVLLELKDIIVAHGLKVPSYFYLFARSLVTIEGVIEKLNPDLDQFELVSPYLHKSVSMRYNPIKMGEKMLNSLYELSNYMEEFPGDLKNAIRKINSGLVKVDLTHKGIDPMVHTLQRITKQLVSAFMAIALLIGSTLFILYDVKPLWGDTSIFGIIGIVLALILTFGMLNNIKKGDYDNT
jgi:ubiquinone biosynthesis protein